MTQDKSVVKVKGSGRYKSRVIWRGIGEEKVGSEAEKRAMIRLDRAHMMPVSDG